MDKRERANLQSIEGLSLSDHPYDTTNAAQPHAGDHSELFSRGALLSVLKRAGHSIAAGRLEARTWSVQGAYKTLTLCMTTGLCTSLPHSMS